MLGNSGYASKKRKKPAIKQKKTSDGTEIVKSNPSKRHRDRLNGELERLMELLPFSEEVRSRLDKLSVLRLSVGYLRVKSYFNVSLKSNKSNLMFPEGKEQNGSNMDTTGFSDGDLLLQALDGFVMVVTSNGLVFYVSPTINDYLGFHQSDVVHQSVFELIHNDDRAMFRQQLHFALNPPTGTDGDRLQSCGSTVMYSPEQLPPENSSFLERNFVCRFRCLLDNFSGFLALNFQGRLKYLHGQKGLRGNGPCSQTQLALFTIAMPVHPPTIVEIRAKMLFFQSKHKLDFTPMGIDNRGKVILGYSETELCMKGSGYQFIHAADMMHCADNHLRMIKTGESGLTVFRLLSKSGGWVWVKANAKMIFKEDRPDFIIAYQKALVKAEGEEYLRQRRLQLPFTFTTGEAVLYDTGPTVDLSDFQFNKMFRNNDVVEDVTPGSLVDCFLKQDEAAYSQIVNNPLPVDEVFVDSRALLSIPGDAWQENRAKFMTGAPVVVKDEARQSMMTVIDNLENGDLCSVLQNLDVDDSELMEWENALNRLNQGEGHQNNVGSELDSVFTNDIFDYIDTLLFKKNGEHLNESSPNCITAINNHQHDPFSQETTGLCESQLFPTPSPECIYSPHNGIYSHQEDRMNGPVITGLRESVHMFNNTQKLSHIYPFIKADANLPHLQHPQLQDIFNSSVGIPQLSVPDASDDDASAIFQSCGQVHMGCCQDISGQSSQILPGLKTGLQVNGQMLQRSAEQAIDILPPLIPCNDSKMSTHNIPVSVSLACLKGNLPSQTHNQQVQQWPQSQDQMSRYNRHEQMPICHIQASESFSHSGVWQNNDYRMNHVQQGGLGCSQAATQSSCMFSQHFSSSPAGGKVMALSRPSDLRGAEVSLNQSSSRSLLFPVEPRHISHQPGERRHQPTEHSVQNVLLQAHVGHGARP